jgi:CHAT domain-containing protein/Tfp pilus assembly protein PilF
LGFAEGNLRGFGEKGKGWGRIIAGNYLFWEQVKNHPMNGAPYLRPLLLWLVFGILAPSASAQNTPDDHYADSLFQAGLALQRKAQYKAAIVPIQEALALKRQWLADTDLELADMLHALGQCQYSMGDAIKATKSFEESLKIRRVNYGENHVDIGKSLNNLGLCYMWKQDFSTAIKHLELSIRVKKQAAKIDSISLSTSYLNLGNCYYFRGDFERSLQYHSLCYELRSGSSPANPIRIADALVSIGTDYLRMLEIDRSLDYYSKALDIMEKSGSGDLVKLAGLYDNIGSCYSLARNFEKALEYHKKSLSTLESKGDLYKADIARAYMNLGMVKREMRRFEEALEDLRQSLEIRTNLYGVQNPEAADTRYSIAKCYHLKGDLDSAVVAYENAFAFTPKGTRSVFNNPDMEVQAYTDYGVVLTDLYKKTKDPVWLQRAVSQFDNGLAALQRLREYQAYLSSKSRLTGLKTPLFENAILALHMQEEAGLDPEAKEKAFYYAEQSKGWALFEAMKESQALQTGGLPKELVEEDYSLRADLAYLERKYQEQLVAGKDPLDQEMLETQRQILELRERELTVKKRYEQEYPEYHKARYNLETVGLKEVQAGLKPNETLLEYFVGDQHLLILTVNAKQSQIFAFPLDSTLHKMATLMREGLAGFEDYANKSEAALAASLELYTRAASGLYRQLIAPIEDHLTKSLIIVPDGILGLLPFEALLKEKPSNIRNFGGYAYLINDYQIGYAYSATLRKEMKEKKHRESPERPLLVMAPFSEPVPSQSREDTQNKIKEMEEEAIELSASRDEEKPLIYSGEEGRLASAIWGGDFFEGREASLKRFMETAGQYKMIHLCTHARANDKLGAQSYLTFGKDTLYARDIYNLRLNADLVVLSACETGHGELQRGEGVIGLGRAFAYAGAKSMVTTLWAVNDNATKEVIQRFHFYLHKGYEKDEALRVAKLQFMKKNPGVLRHPYFWAGFVVVGG